MFFEDVIFNSPKDSISLAIIDESKADTKFKVFPALIFEANEDVESSLISFDLLVILNIVPFREEEVEDDEFNTLSIVKFLAD